MKTSIKPGTRVKVVALAQADAFYTNRKVFIGETGIIVENHPYTNKNGGWFGCNILFDKKIEEEVRTRDNMFFFYKIKLKKI